MLQAGGKLCPRVELMLENLPAARLARWGMTMGIGDPAWQFLFNITTASWDASRREAFFLYLVSVVGHPDIRARIARDAERARREAQESQRPR